MTHFTVDLMNLLYLKLVMGLFKESALLFMQRFQRIILVADYTKDHPTFGTRHIILNCRQVYQAFHADLWYKILA